LSREEPVAAAAEILRRRPDGGHIGLWLAELAKRCPGVGDAPLEAYLALVNRLRDADCLKPLHVRALLLPKMEGEKYLPISAAAALRWRSPVAQRFASTLVDAMPKEYAKDVVRSLGLKQSGADFYKQVKRSIRNLPPAQQDTPALRLLVRHGLIPPERELGRIAKKLPAPS
jgi:hypothetical protein